MSVPLVSVVMPVRDGAAFLEEAVRSILRQTFAEFEFIVVDDGSRDATPALLRDLAGADARIRIEAQASLGIVAALNRGLQRARGALVARMDADDVSHPDRLRLLVELLAAHPDTAAAGSAYTPIDGRGRPGDTVVPPTEPAAIRQVLAVQNCMAHPTMMMRRDRVLAAGGYRPAFVACEDYDLWLRLSERHDLRNRPEPLLLYREHPGQSTWQGLEARLLSELAVQQAARQRGEGRPDLGGEAGPVTRSVLRASGLTEAEIGAGLRERALIAARNALARGHRGAARAALALARRQGIMPPRAVLRYLRLEARALLAGGAKPCPLPPALGPGERGER